MFKKVLVAAAIALACPAFVFAQDFSFLFGVTDAAAGTTASSTRLAAPGATTGSVNIYSRQGLDWNAADLDFSVSNTSVARITGGEAFLPSTIIGDRFDSNVVTTAADGSGGNLFSVSVLGTGINPGFEAFEDPAFFNATDGYLLATIDYEIVGGGSTDFSFSLGAQGIIDLPSTVIDPTFGTATLTTVPEPSSAILLLMGSVAMVARRKRA